MANGINYKGVRTAHSGPMKSGIVAAGQEISYGALVTRSANGYIKAQTTVANVCDYLGVANNDIRKHAVDGFYAAGEKVPIISNGAANMWVLGGEVITSGGFVLSGNALGNAGARPLGIVSPTSSAYVRTDYTIGRSIDTVDRGNTDYDQSVTSISGNTLTMVNTAMALLDLVEGDWVCIDSTEDAEINRIVSPYASSTTCTVAKTPLATHVNAIKIYKLVQCEVEMI